jgi:hypothetical protein
MVNGFRRALGSPNRLIGLIFIGGYWLYYLFNPLFGSARQNDFGPQTFHFIFPAERVIDALAFAAFALLSLPLISSVNGYNRTMRPADVDVLFPTPVDARIVMGFRFFRDYVGALLFPLIILLFSRRYIPINGLLGALNRPDAGSKLGTSWSFAWLLLALVWTAVGYAATLFINRSDLASDRNKRILNWSLNGLVLFTAGYIALGLRQELSWESALRIAESPVLRILHLPATLATAVALAPIGNVVFGLVSALALCGIIGFGVSAALSQVSWMYDQAAVKGFESQASVAARKTGDPTAVLLDQARRGKLKAGRSGFVQRLKMQGGWALLWKEILWQRRTMRTGFVVLTLVSITYSLIPIFIVAGIGKTRGQDAVGGMIIGFQALGVFMGTMSTAQTGFLEFMRRVDLLKPLPFSAMTLVLFEIFGKAMMAVLISWAAILVAFVFRPDLWQYLLASAMFTPTLAVLLTGSNLLILLFFPGVDDPTQRSFRGLMTMLGIALANIPGVLALLGPTLLTHQILLGAALALLVNSGMIAGLSFGCGKLYESYNPSE